MMQLIIGSIVVGALATVAARFFERGLAHLRVGTRHAWTFAILATAALPFLPRLPANSVSEIVPQVTMPAIVITGAASAAPESRVNIVIIVWALMSLAIGMVYLLSYVRLQRARRKWQRTNVANCDVYMSDRFGPAIFGFLSPRIVVPEWIRAASSDEQRLILLHEREHIGARDHLLLLLSMLATVAMPWNPFVWLQTRKLRFTMETDCDQRVLAAVPDRERYATLLVDVGSRQMGLFLTPALAEHKNGLEQRITMIAKTMIQNRWKAAVLTVAGIAVTVVACESRYPQEPVPPREAARVTDGMMMEAERVEVSELKDGATDSGERTRVEIAEMRDGAFSTPDAAELVIKHYPPMLRAAGVGGTVRVRAMMYADGRVDGFEVVGTSGHKALDEAGLKVARDMKVYPSMKFGEGQASQNVDFIFEFAPKMTVRTRTPLKVSELAPLPRQINVDKVPGPTLNNTKEMIRELIDNYPPVLRDAGIGGKILLLVRVNPDGTLRDAKVKDSSGHQALDEAALKVARKMKFQPAEGQSTIPDGWFPAPVLFVSSN